MRNACVLSIILLAVFVPLIVFGASLDDLRKQISDKEAEIKRLETEITKYQNSLEKQSELSQTLKNEIKKLETQIKKLNTDIVLTRTQITATELRLAQLDNSISAKEKKIADDRVVLSELIKNQQESDEYSIVEMMLARDSLADFFNEQQEILDVQKNMQVKLGELRQEKAALDTEHQKRENEKQKLSAFQKDLANRKKIQEGIASSKNTLLKDSKNQETRYQKLVKDRARERELTMQEIQSIEDELRKQINLSSLPSKGSGVLGWPVENPIITQGFGFTQFATTYGSDIYKGKGHNGVDFRASIGARVLSAADGTVKDFGNTDPICPGGSYGKWVVVEHNNGFTTVYGHLSQVAATRGQQVKRGQVIAYSGDTGYVTGPHLHFTVWASNTYKYSPTRYCGLVPTGGYLNPLDYL